jgi:hypothetical protein
VGGIVGGGVEKSILKESSLWDKVSGGWRKGVGFFQDNASIKKKEEKSACEVKAT